MTELIRIGRDRHKLVGGLGPSAFLTTDERTQVVAICGRNRERA